MRIGTGYRDRERSMEEGLKRGIEIVWEGAEGQEK